MLVAAGNGRLEVDQALISAGANKDKAATVVAQAGHSLFRYALSSRKAACNQPIVVA